MASFKILFDVDKKQFSIELTKDDDTVVTVDIDKNAVKYLYMISFSNPSVALLTCNVDDMDDSGIFIPVFNSEYTCRVRWNFGDDYVSPFNLVFEFHSNSVGKGGDTSFSSELDSSVTDNIDLVRSVFYEDFYVYYEKMFQYANQIRLLEKIKSNFSEVRSVVSDILTFSDDIYERFSEVNDTVKDNSNTLEMRISGVSQVVNEASNSIISYMTESITDINTALKSVSVDLTPVTSSLNDMGSTIQQLSTSISSAVANIIDIHSLNGANGTYKDGSTVTVAGLSSLFLVDASFLMKNDGNSYVCIYKLMDKSDNSIVLYSPSNFVALAS